jgi:hypothetical protein
MNAHDIESMVTQEPLVCCNCDRVIQSTRTCYLGYDMVANVLPDGTWGEPEACCMDCLDDIEISPLECDEHNTAVRHDV